MGAKPLGRTPATLHHGRKSDDGKRNPERIGAIRAVSVEHTRVSCRVCENEELKQSFPVRKFIGGAPNLTIARFLSFISTSEWHAQFRDVLVVGGRSPVVLQPADFGRGGLNGMFQDSRTGS